MNIVLRNPLRMNAVVSKYASDEAPGSRHGVTKRNQLHNNVKYVTLTSLASVFCRTFFNREAVETLQVQLLGACATMTKDDMSTADVALSAAFTGPTASQMAQQEQQLFVGLMQFMQVET